ncbi:MAG: response regulator [Gammaproteobacteria bacterium]|nr:response regulator [Gammaproteobacteria bacterium]
MNGRGDNKNEILVVDDSATILATAKKMLQEEFIVHIAKDGGEAWNVISENENIKVVFSDLQMPVMNGMQLLLKIRESDETRISSLPVIMVTGQSDSPAGKRAVFDIGATDFIGKPFDAMDLLSRARSNSSPHRRESDHLDRSQQVFVTPSGFQNMGREALVSSQESKEKFSVVQIEISNIEEIKKEIDSKSVRQIIVSLVKRISSMLRDKDIATRIGENRFAILLYADANNTKLAVERLCECLKKLVFEVGGKALKKELAYGYSSVDCYDKKVTFVDLCKQADLALKEAKNMRLGNQIAAYSEPGKTEPQKDVNEDADLWSDMTHIVDGDFHLVNASHEDALVKCMEAYIEHVRKKLMS